MAYLQTADQWLSESALLLHARPSTTRVTTKYNVPSPAKVSENEKKRKAPSKTEPTGVSSSQQGAVTGSLVLKTFDPVSGACLKYRTDKAAEVGRLVASLGQLGHIMNGTGVESLKAAEAPVPESMEVDTHRATEQPPASSKQPSQPPASGGGKSKKKKSGKR